MADNCCISSGGTVRITIDGVVYPVRGSVTINPTNGERTVVTNMDGTVTSTFKPEAPTVEATLSDWCGLSVMDLQNIACVDIQIDLDEVDRTYILVHGFLAGRPSLNPETGEISGVTLSGSYLREINN